MEHSGISGFMRNRRLGSYFDASYGTGLNFSGPYDEALAVKKEEDEEKEQQQRQKKKKKKADEDVLLLLDADEEDEEEEDGGGLLSVTISWIRIVVCFVTMMFTTLFWALIMVLLLPWPYQRVRQGNIYGHFTGRLLMWILGNPIKIEGAEYGKERAIYISNHASPIDIFLIMWLTPTGTVGIAKKEIIWYPLFGQLYVLANHIRIDRSNPSASIESVNKAARAIVENNLSLIIFPEGTRAKDGRLLPFKKGFVHLALQTGRPIVPIVLTGTHRAWRKGSLYVRPTPLTVKYLPPIRTHDWTADKIEDYVKLVHDVYVKNLPESQRPPPLHRNN